MFCATPRSGGSVARIIPVTPWSARLFTNPEPADDGKIVKSVLKTICCSAAEESAIVRPI